MRGTPDQAAALMKPYAGAIEAWEVGAEVGNVMNNRPELITKRLPHGVLLRVAARIAAFIALPL